MVTKEQLINLVLKIKKRDGNCAVRHMWLISLPLGLLLFAFAGFFNLINFRVELHSVVMLSTIFVIFLFFKSHNAYIAVCKFRSNFVEFQDALVKFINKNLLTIGHTQKASSSLDDFLADFSIDMRNENFSSVAAGIFPTLGILGTFISIAMSMPEFTSQSSEALEHEISVLLGGVGTAFYISIYGIFLSIWWIFFEKSGLSQFDRDIVVIKNETTEFFWGKEEIEQTYFHKSMENFEKLNSVFENISSQEFTQNLNRTLEQRMLVFENIIKQELHAAQKVGEILDISRQKLNLFISQQQEMANSFTDMIQHIKELTHKLQEHNSETNEAGQILSTQYANSVNISKELANSVNTLGVTLNALNVQNIESIYSGVTENIETMKRQLDTIGSNLNGHLESFDAKFLDKLQNTLKLIDSETSQIVSKISELDKDKDT